MTSLPSKLFMPSVGLRPSTPQITELASVRVADQEVKARVGKSLRVTAADFVFDLFLILLFAVNAIARVATPAE